MKYQEWSTAPVCPGGRLALEAAGVPSLLALVLSARGVESADQARRLLDPAGETLLDPMGMAGMDRAAARVRLALERKESIAVYGDYDVDGITSTCLLLDVLTRRGGQVTAYIPDRLEEGYGLNREAAERLARAGVSLIITVDCGITAVEEVAYAKELGMDVVITDHHACKDTLPPAQAVVNPQRPDCPYPFKGLAGVGVALKLAMAVAGPEGADAVFADYCDLAAVGTVADVMPMTGENRAIVRAGLERLNPARRTGFAHLIRCAGVEDKPVTATSIGYLLAPRINAAGRMGQADVARELLLTQDDARAELLAQQLCELNRRRQTIEGDIFDQCVQRLDREPQSGVIVLAGEQWHQGVVGIVASRLTEKYGCPAFMICLDHGLGKGSCRSWGDVNLFRLLTAAAPLLESFGGHALAAGFTVREENIPALAQCLREELRRTSGGAVLPSVLEVDAAVPPQLLTVPEVEALDRLEPCGTGNPRPLLSLSGAQVQFFSQVGRGRHLKLRRSAGRHLFFRQRRRAGAGPRRAGGCGLLPPDQRVPGQPDGAAAGGRPAPRPHPGPDGAGALRALHPGGGAHPPGGPGFAAGAGGVCRPVALAGAPVRRRRAGGGRPAPHCPQRVPLCRAAGGPRPHHAVPGGDGGAGPAGPHPPHRPAANYSTDPGAEGGPERLPHPAAAAESAVPEQGALSRARPCALDRLHEVNLWTRS